MEANDSLYYCFRAEGCLLGSRPCSGGKVFTFEGCCCPKAAWGFSRNLNYKGEGGGFKTQREKEMREIIKMGINLCFVGGSLKKELDV